MNIITKELFWDRKVELEGLRAIHETKNAAFVKLYGRRRVGKTELILRFLRELPKRTYLYYYVDRAEDEVYYQTLSDAIERQIGDKVKINSWDDFFDYVAKKSQDRFVLVIDEVPRFMDAKSIFLTRLQHAWGTDPKLENSKVMIILVGSSISMMDRMTNQNGPLYGRITHTKKLSPFRYVDLRGLFKGKPEEEIIKHYAVFGGTPHYVRIAYLESKELDEAIMTLIVRPQSTLSKEADELFDIEGVREPARYVSILTAIAQGNLKLPQIGSLTGIQMEQLPTYLNTLHDRLDLVKPADPIGGKKKNARYEVSDNFFRFWFKFVFPHRSSIELGNTKDIHKLIHDQLPAFTGHVFEKIVRELFILYQGRDIMGVPILFDEIGSWWPSKGELPGMKDTGDIDVVARHEKSKTTYVADVKFTTDEYGFREFNVFQERIKNLPYGGSVLPFIVSRSGFKSDFVKHAKERKIPLIDLEQLSSLFDKA